MTGSAAQELRKRLRMGKIGVFSRDETVLKDVPPPRLFKVIGTGVQNLTDGIRICNRHGTGALFVRHGVQRNSEIERNPFLGKGAHLVRQPAG